MEIKTEAHKAQHKQTNDKRYYTIGEVAEILNVNTSLIRYWERQFASLQPKKNRKGHRLFTRYDVDQLKYIYFLVKERHYSLQYAKQTLENPDAQDQEAFRLAEQLRELREFLLNLRDNLDQIGGNNDASSSSKTDPADADDES